MKPNPILDNLKASGILVGIGPEPIGLGSADSTVPDVLREAVARIEGEMLTNSKGMFGFRCGKRERKGKGG